jgi:hypothetical protein
MTESQVCCCTCLRQVDVWTLYNDMNHLEKSIKDACSDCEIVKE